MSGPNNVEQEGQNGQDDNQGGLEELVASLSPNPVRGDIPCSPFPLSPEAQVAGILSAALRPNREGTDPLLFAQFQAGRGDLTDESR